MIHHLDHVNLVVEDLSAMTAFYCDTLGFEITKQATIAGGWIDQTVGLEGVEAEVVYLETPHVEGGTRLELIQYHSPTATRPNGQNEPHRPGLRHLAFNVDDIETAVRKLRSAGTHLLSEIQTVPDSQVRYAGGERKRLIYFHDPEGNLLELCWYGVIEVTSQ